MSILFSFMLVLLPHLFFMALANQPCRELLSCSIKKGCVKLPWLVERIGNAKISAEMYNDIDSAIDYPCIFTSSCPRECTSCSLCNSSKRRVLEVLTGSKVNPDECHELVNCATDCVLTADNNFATINHCLRHVCAYHCFNGSCPKCSSFITKVGVQSTE
ncbi:unnamed protein product [Heligmosomoides polygyrus]|uniref:ShKT domain-containing protein n=1 Tax=Heligmosomoides polygyrus TaxID=6339 RepID=A0A3P8GVH8_HELPZ|nr:unnamed protein product [Heligmosomoides polygyrus]